MASEKVSKKDLQKRIARLQGKIEKTAERLEKQQSELTSTQVQIRKLRKQDNLGIELGTLDGRQRELTGIIEETLSRLNELEQVEKALRRSIDGVQNHTQTLERAVADAATRGDQLLQRIKKQEGRIQALPSALQRLEALQSDLDRLQDGSRGPEPGGQKELDELRSRTQALEQRVAKVHGALKTLKAGAREDNEPSPPQSALPDQLSALREDLQNLQALNLAHRLSGLEQALSAERDQIGAVARADQELKQQLGSVAGITQDLGHRVDSLITGNQQLSQLFENVDAKLQTTNRDSQQHQQQLAAHEARLEEQQQLIDAAADGRSGISDDMTARLDALETSQKTTQQAADSLGVQQTRQDHDTGTLRRSLRRRSAVGLLMMLLIAGTLGFLLFREAVELRATQQAMQSEIATIEKARSDLSNLGESVEMLRERSSRLDEAVTQATAQLQQFDDATLPGLSGQVDRLSRDVEALGRDRQRQAEAISDLQAGQAQLKTEVSETTTAVEEVATEPAEATESVGETETSDLTDAKSSAPSTTAPRVTQPEAEQPWKEAQKARHYTLQIGGFHKPSSLASFARQHRIGDDSGVYHGVHQGKKWYVLFYGRYPTLKQALDAKRQLPPALAAHGPWARRIPGDGDLNPL